MFDVDYLPSNHFHLHSRNICFWRWRQRCFCLDGKANPKSLQAQIQNWSFQTVFCSLESCLDAPANIKPSSLVFVRPPVKPVLSGAQASRPWRHQISRGYDPHCFVWHRAGVPYSYFWEFLAAFIHFNDPLPELRPTSRPRPGCLTIQRDWCKIIASPTEFLTRQSACWGIRK